MLKLRDHSYTDISAQSHLSMYPQQQESDFKGKLADYTIPVRLYAVDAPEIKKGADSPYPSMPFAEEAKEWTSSNVKGKVVEVKLLQKDQYNRVIGKVTTTGSAPSVDLSLGLARNGFAMIYRGKGAEYDGNREAILEQISYAQKMRLGVWSNGVENAQSPADFKRMMKSRAKEAAASASSTQ